MRRDPGFFVQETRNKKQETRNKKQETRAKKQKLRNKKKEKRAERRDGMRGIGDAEHPTLLDLETRYH
ncbi:hypothetical protein DHB64_07700 [Antarcticibacterium sp. W02-3]|nr:hypothetical protein [Antarcticibacterium sp. W02-3]